MSEIERYKELKARLKELEVNVVAAEKDFSEYVNCGFFSDKYRTIRNVLVYSALALAIILVGFTGTAAYGGMLLVVWCVVMVVLMFTDQKQRTRLAKEFAEKFPEKQAWLDADDES